MMVPVPVQQKHVVPKRLMTNELMTVEFYMVLVRIK